MTSRTEKSRQSFNYVPEPDDDFLKLWPHRHDYLWAPHPDPKTKPDWQTQSRHPLSDRLIQQGAYLYGVRFGPKTHYALLDIDAGSAYHPRRDALAIDRLCAALEPLGLIEHLALTSSDSHGLHLYFPFDTALPSWQVASAVTTLLENDGFKVVPGQMEVFPNVRPYAEEGQRSLFNGHRLPLQQGSYLLDHDLVPYSNSQTLFSQQWQRAAGRNDIDKKVLSQVLKQAKRQHYRMTGKAQKFLNDLNAEIEPGWSGAGQTNRLLGRIAMRCYIFAHTLYAAAPLTGQALIDDIVRIARALPGFIDFCGHVEDIVERAQEWATAIEKSHYFPYQTRQAKGGKEANQDTEPSWNQRQRLSALQRIQQAIQKLLAEDNWPPKATARLNLIRKLINVSGSTLYQHKVLWHPDHDPSKPEADATPPDPPAVSKAAGIGCAEGAPIPAWPTSLLGRIGWNSPQDKDSSLSSQASEGEKQATGWNSPGRFPQGSEAEGGPVPPPRQLVLQIKQMLQAAKVMMQATREENCKEQAQQAQADYRAQMLDWLNSGDPLLVAEAQQVMAKWQDTDVLPMPTD